MDGGIFCEIRGLLAPVFMTGRICVRQEGENHAA